MPIIAVDGNDDENCYWAISRHSMSPGALGAFID